MQQNILICTEMQQELFYTTAEVEAILKVHRATLYRWRRDKKIKARKIGGSIRYSIKDIQKLAK